MALRKPMCRIAGQPGYCELPATDTLSPTWSGTASLAAQVIALGATVRLTAAMTSTTQSGTLKVATPVVLGVIGLPAGLFLLGGSASADGAVTIALNASAAVTISTAAALTVTAVQPR